MIGTTGGGVSPDESRALNDAIYTLQQRYRGNMYMIQLCNRKTNKTIWEKLPGKTLEEACAFAQRVHPGYVWTMATTL